LFDDVVIRTPRYTRIIFDRLFSLSIK